MELDITEFFHEACPRDYSASAAEIGQDAGRITWRAACADAPDYANLLDTEEKREAFRGFVLDSGGWSAEEIAAWSDTELVALLMQWISGDIREAGLDVETPDWSAYQEGCEASRYASRIFGGPMSADGRVYFSLD